MGFFRFRRSIKILPGIRWNFGKRSSSISFGGRGFHYTIGTHGTRTTIGIPGTGISYTSVNRAKRKWVRKQEIDVDEAVKWVAKQKETFRLEVPDREPGDQPATQSQIQKIHELVQGISGLDFASLGRKQASAVIGAITAERDRFTEQKVQEYRSGTGRSSGFSTVIWIAVAVITVAILIGSFTAITDRTPPRDTVSKTTPAPASRSPSPALPSPALKSGPLIAATAPTAPATPASLSSQDAQRAAIKRYPELGVAGSKFNLDFVARHKLYEKTRPDYFHDPSWPTHLADEVAQKREVR